MCGRFLLESEVEDLVARYNAEYSLLKFKAGEVFPSENALIITKEKDKKVLSPMKWGFPMFNSKRLIINAKIETADKKTIFKSSLFERRCIVPVNGFYEWKTENNKKFKHIIEKQNNKIFSLGGIYNNGSFVILTMDASKKMKNIHDRMPLILEKEEEELWLSSFFDLQFINTIINNKDDLDLSIKLLN